MITILLLLTAGVLIGLVVIRKPILHRLNNRLLNGSIYLLLFLLGCSVGSNEAIIKNLDKIGLEAIAIAFASIAGSVCCSTLLFKLLFKRDEE